MRAEEQSSRRQEALNRFERATELPLLVLAAAMLPLLAVPLLFDLPQGLEATFTIADWFIWAVFAMEFVVRLLLTTQRWRFLRREWPDLLIVVLPFLRPLRVVRSARALRALRLVRLTAFLGEIGQETRRLLVRHRLHYALLVVMMVVLGCAALVVAVEQDGDGTIRTFGDGLWWAITTVTTVGYGDRYPVTAAGQGVAAFLMITGIALFGVLTANLAAFVLERVPKETEPDKLDEVLRRLTSLEKLVERSLHGPASD